LRFARDDRKEELRFARDDRKEELRFALPWGHLPVEMTQAGAVINRGAIGVSP